MPADFVTMLQWSQDGIVALLDRADEMRVLWRERRMPAALTGRRIALIWDAGGFRNRVAFELAIAAMGGTASLVPGELDAREPIEDVVRYLENWVDAIVARTRTHRHMERLAAAAGIPVVNARTDFNHPCEILGDLAWIRSRRGSLDGLEVVFVGEATNLCHPWMEAAARLPIHVVQACPAGYEVAPEVLARIRSGAVGSMDCTQDLDAALGAAEVVYTDCWPGRGAPAGERALIASRFLPYQVTAARLERIPRPTYFLPCPPVTRGEEVSADAMARFGSQVYEAKEYLLFAQAAVLSTLVGGRPAVDAGS
jgi:ornithine carbamoyltransferase